MNRKEENARLVYSTDRRALQQMEGRPAPNPVRASNEEARELDRLASIGRFNDPVSRAIHIHTERRLS